MTAPYLSLEVAWKFTPRCWAHRVPCQSLFWEVVRWDSRVWWACAEEAESSGLSCPTSAIPVGWGLQKSRCWQTKPWWSSLQKLKHLPLAALCWLLPWDYQPWLGTGRMEPPPQPLPCTAQRLGKTSFHLSVRLNTPPGLLPASFVAETVVCGWKAGRNVLKLLLPRAERLWLKASWLRNRTELQLGEQRDLAERGAATPDTRGNSRS